MTRTSRPAMPAAPLSGAPALSRRRLLALAILTPALAFAASGARAQSLNELRAAGAIGERFDGYTVARTGGAASSVSKAVNAERRKIYAQRAAQQGIKVGQVGRVYAKQIFNKAPGGTYFLQKNGEWIRK